MRSAGFSLAAVGQRRRIFARKQQHRVPVRGLVLACAVVAASIGAAGLVQFAASFSTPAQATQQEATQRETTQPETTQAGATQAGAAPQPRPVLLADRNVAVVDGETLRLSGQVVRLDGVAAPHRGDACRVATDCAGAAVVRLADLVRDQRVACTVRGQDGAGRAVARCQAGGTDMSRAVVASGWALAAAGQSDLAAAERSARMAHLGLWAAQ